MKVREPRTVEEARQVLGELSRAQPDMASYFMMTLLDELIDLAASGGKPSALRGPVDELFKLKFYKTVIVKCVMHIRESGR